MDLLGILSADDFTARIERAYTQQLSGPLARWWAGVRRSLKPSASAGGGLVPGSISVDLSGQSKEALAERLDLPKRVRAKTGSRVHVVFDEFKSSTNWLRRTSTRFCGASSSTMVTPRATSSRGHSST